MFFAEKLGVAAEIGFGPGIFAREKVVCLALGGGAVGDGGEIGFFGGYGEFTFGVEVGFESYDARFEGFDEGVAGVGVVLGGEEGEAAAEGGAEFARAGG